jgi:hypothetical protein
MDKTLETETLVAGEGHPQKAWAVCMTSILGA